MTTRPLLVPNPPGAARRLLPPPPWRPILATAGGSAQAGTGPDVTVFSFTDIASYGSATASPPIRSAPAPATGDAPVSWCSFFDSSRASGSAETDIR